MEHTDLFNHQEGYQNGDITLMLKDKPLLRISLYDNNHERTKLYDISLLPIDLLNLINKGDINSPQFSIGLEYSFIGWLKDRHIPLSRENAKWLLNNLGLGQSSNNHLITLKCRGLSLTDCYWIKLKPTDTWTEFNLYQNSFNKVLEEIALIGTSKFSVQNKIRTPELSTDGTYAKCWHREEDGKIYLYKTDAGNTEVEAEVVSSKIADILGIDHVEYTMSKLYNRKCSKCICISNEDRAIIPFETLAIQYSKSKNISNLTIPDIEKIIQSANGNLISFYQMLVFDGLIGNVDRHSRNYGFYQDTETGELLGLHPLFDHNCSINPRYNIERPSPILNSKTILELSRYGLNNCKGTLQLDKLWDYYNSRECTKYFNQLHKRLDELNMLKENFKKVTLAIS